MINACIHNNIIIADLLIDCDNANHGHVDNIGMTALMWLCYNSYNVEDREPIAVKLVKSGKSNYEYNNNAARMIAQKNGYHAVVAAIDELEHA